MNKDKNGMRGVDSVLSGAFRGVGGDGVRYGTPLSPEEAEVAQRVFSGFHRRGADFYSAPANPVTDPQELARLAAEARGSKHSKTDPMYRNFDGPTAGGEEPS